MLAAYSHGEPLIPILYLRRHATTSKAGNTALQNGFDDFSDWTLPSGSAVSDFANAYSYTSFVNKGQRSRTTMLRVTEIFRSIQGESSHAGRPCTFVRLTGCPMRCVWCDSEYTFSGGEHFSLDDVTEKVRGYGSNLVEVTGGEPLAQKAAFALITRLCDEGYEVLVETGGYVSTAEVDQRAKIILDVKCPASGEEERNHWPNLDRLRADADEVKFVIADQADWLYALRIIEQYDLENRARAVLISPAWDKVDLKDCADWITASGKNVRMQLQLHKYIWGPEARGV